MRFCFQGLTGLLFYAACAPPPGAERVELPEGVAPAPARMHVVVVLVDTLRADRLGLYGYERSTSPNIDALAEQSFVFDAASGAAPWTLPSVVGLMTSTLPIEHRVLASGQVLAPEIETLPLRMSELGFKTAGFVTNPFGAGASGLDRGYDHLLTDEMSGHAVQLEAVEEWLDAHPDKNHFLYIHSTEPHRPYKSPVSIQERFGQVSQLQRKQVQKQLRQMRTLSQVDFDAGLPLGSTDNDSRQSEAIQVLEGMRGILDNLYDAGVAWGDANTGALIEVLRERGMWDSTLFVFTSDHGEELFEHGGWLHHRTLYQELVHVPLLIHFPGQSTGSRISSNVSVIDIFPTLMHYMDQSVVGLRGRNLLGVIAEGKDELRICANRFNQMVHYGPDVDRYGHVNIAMRRGRWKGILNLDLDTLELYDIGSDPEESRDLAAEQPAEVDSMRAFARDWFSRLKEPLVSPGSDSDMDPKVLERLRALGYVR